MLKAVSDKNKGTRAQHSKKEQAWEENDIEVKRMRTEYGGVIGGQGSGGCYDDGSVQ